MYAAKNKIKANINISHLPLECSTIRLKKEAELQKAQTGRRFILRYAPQFSSSSKKMTGVEALVCLKASDGMIHGFSEAAALIADLEEWMIDEVCRQAKNGMITEFR